ncbi:hypothetical protein OBBRIDRAFT_479629 [Obba rivulosa]|uniref:Uncharacterized protein n=1 Tax=Obba rivulosa TaxID=1052685 RepID=A0A8E2AXB6_9APHY|nr:hypothetical protein OBBRIDRAFT_479629 [Obba rivulosa]
MPGRLAAHCSPPSLGQPSTITCMLRSNADLCIVYRGPTRPLVCMGGRRVCSCLSIR